MRRRMLGFAETLLFSAIMGLSIFLSLPIVLSKKTGEMRTKLFNAIAIGILIFLVADVFADVAAILYNGSYYGYGSSPYYDAVFAIFLTAGFLVLYPGGEQVEEGPDPDPAGADNRPGHRIPEPDGGAAIRIAGSRDWTGRSRPGRARRVHLPERDRGFSHNVAVFRTARQEDRRDSPAAAPRRAPTIIGGAIGLLLQLRCLRPGL